MTISESFVFEKLFKVCIVVPPEDNLLHELVSLAHELSLVAASEENLQFLPKRLYIPLHPPVRRCYN